MDQPSLQSRHVYHQLMHLWGEATDIISFDGNPSADRPPIDIGVWESAEDEAVNLNTLGMSHRLMAGAGHPVELSLMCGRALRFEDTRRLAAFLANLTQYPFDHKLKLDWWERVTTPRGVPVFDGCSNVLLAPWEGEGPRSWIDLPHSKVKILQVVPITPRENHILGEHGKEAFLSYVKKARIDILSPREDSPRGVSGA